MKIRTALSSLAIGAYLFAADATFAATTRTWDGEAGDNLLGNLTNWSGNVLPVPGSADTMLFNGTVAGNLVLTNNTGFDANPGCFLNVAAAQTGSLTLVETNGGTGRIRLSSNCVSVATGAGALSIGNGVGTPFPIALGIGNGTIHGCTNDSANPVTFNSDVFFLMGGGGAHTLSLGGTGDWQLNSSFQAQNSGSSLALAVRGSGTVNLVGAATPTITYLGTYGNVTVSSGTLRLGAANAIGNGNTLVLTGGNLDSSVVSLVNSGNNPQSWNGNFGFVGSQSLDLGLGPVTMNASRIVTVSNNTLTVGGGIAGTGFSLTKAGAGTLVVNSANTYTGGTVISNGVLRIGNAAGIPSGSATASGVNALGTLDVNGSSPFISALNGSGIVDTVSGGTPTLTVGVNDANGSFRGAIQNTAGTLALSKTGLGTLTLGGASTYSGGTTVGGGALLVTNLTGSGTGSGAVTVNSSATFGGSGSVSGSVDWQSGSLAQFTQGSPLTVSGSVTLNNNATTVFVPGGVPLGVGTNVLMTYNTVGSTGQFATNAPSYTGAGVSAGTASRVVTSGGQVLLIVSSTFGNIITWTNNGSGNWSTAADWSSNPNIPKNAGDAVILGVGAAFTTVTLDTNVSVGGIIITNANSFAIADAGQTLTLDNIGAGAGVSVAAGTSNSIAAAVSLNDKTAASMFTGSALTVSGAISGTSPANTLAASGAGTLTLSGNNSYGPSAGTVGTALSGGVTVQLGHNNAFGAGDVTITNTSVLRAVTSLATANNIDVAAASALVVDNNGNAATLSGTISGLGSMNKNGTGILTVSGANTYAGNTTINGGTFKLGVANAIPSGVGLGNVTVNTNSTLDLNGLSPTFNGLQGGGTVDSLTGGAVTLTVGENDAFATFTGYVNNTAGSLALVKNGTGNQTLGGTNNYTGGTTINAGLLRVGNNNSNASGLGIVVGLGTGAVVNNGTLEFNLTGTNTFTNAISGSGAVQTAFNPTLTLVLPNANTFSGAVTVNGGALWIKTAAALGTGPKNILVAQGTAGNSQFHLDGSSGNIITDTNIDFFLSNVNGCLFNEAGTNTILGNIFCPFGGGNPYVKVNGGFLTLAGNVADGGTFNGARSLTLGGAGNGLFSGVAQDMDGRAPDGTPNVNTLGGLIKVDAGTWTVSGTNTTVGTANVNGGTLVLNGQWAGGPVVINSGGTLTGTGFASNLTVSAGSKFVPGGYGSVGSFTVSNILTMSGATYVSLNKSLAQSNTVVNVIVVGNTNVTATGSSSLIVSNLGPALVAGDTFYLFNQGVTNGNLMTITGPAGVNFTNNLAVDGSISVLAPPVATNPTNITFSASGGSLTLSWPADHQGWFLQTQTNLQSVGLSTNWFDVTGSSATNQAVITVSPGDPTVFFRLRNP